MFVYGILGEKESSCNGKQSCCNITTKLGTVNFRMVLEMSIGWKEGLSNCYILLAQPTKLHWMRNH